MRSGYIDKSYNILIKILHKLVDVSNNRKKYIFLRQELDAEEVTQSVRTFQAQKKIIINEIFKERGLKTLRIVFTTLKTLILGPYMRGHLRMSNYGVWSRII